MPIKTIQEIRAHYCLNELAWLACTIASYKYINRSEEYVRQAFLIELTKRSEKLANICEFQLVYNESIWEPTIENSYGNLLYIRVRPQYTAKWYYTTVDISKDFEEIPC